LPIPRRNQRHTDFGTTEREDLAMNRYGMSALLALLPLGACLADGTPLTVPPGQTNPVFPEVQSLLRMKKIPPAVSMYSPAAYPIPEYGGHLGHGGHVECGDPGCTSCRDGGWDDRRPRTRLIDRVGHVNTCGECGAPCPTGTCMECRSKRFSGCWERFRAWLCFRPSATYCPTCPTPYQPPLYTYFECMPQRIPQAPPPQEKPKLRRQCRDCSASACGECDECRTRRFSLLEMLKARPGGRGCANCGRCCDLPAANFCPHCGGDLAAAPADVPPPVATSLKPQPAVEQPRPTEGPRPLSSIRPPAGPGAGSEK
jgi:hypothetical protein